MMSEYPIDPHYLQTDDGYIITLFRLRADFGNNKVSQEELEKRPAVLLVHGFTCLGTEWLIQSPDKSLPGMLAKEGYDCWIACQRGTRYTTGPNKAHIKLSTKDKEYWDFSSDEISYYDIPAFIDYILKQTGQKSLFYVGHSLGTKVFFQLLSSRPEYNSKIKVGAALTPVISGKHCSIFLLKVLFRLLTLVLDNLWKI
jgi:pimeloyl-ACP methyl ester carboxylesterase